MKNARDLAYGLAIGAGLMCLLDPRVGARRRALLRQRSARALHEVETAVGIGARDLDHRLHGVAALVFGKRRPATASKNVLVARVRTKLGRVCAHPHAVEVVSKGDGFVALKGSILEDELARVLSSVARVRGVRAVDNALDVHLAPDVPRLRGGRPPPLLERRSLKRQRFTPATHLVLGALATGLSVVSFVRGHPWGLVAGGLAVLALSHRVAHRASHFSLKQA